MVSVTSNTIGPHLAKMRKKANVSLNYMARQLGMSNYTLSLIELGIGEVDPTLQNKYKAVLLITG